ncbi:unnamed protein product [Fraxinus pennsylvanica]|uniref:DOG1 domain-containing protein n=1 Tax=Fraxinus pennsylvanica TaxID=56036 RepID=A0AAD2EE57_9LAMI|nr:unnamed protein product [Fraxinus pennsylvanica]
MLKAALFKRKKTSKPFKEFYNEWFATLTTTLLPSLRRALSPGFLSPVILSTQVELMHHHFRSYYDALDQAAAADVAQCLYPEWRNSIERSFLWLGDLHPYLFTNLLRSFLADQEPPVDENVTKFLDKSWHVVMAWKSPSKTLTTKVDKIECGLRLMVPALASRWRNAQSAFVENMGTAIGEALAAEMEDMVGVFVDANRLRRSILADILSATDLYQAALFLEALAQFLVGFKDQKLLNEFEKCKIAIN